MSRAANTTAIAAGLLLLAACSSGDGGGGGGGNPPPANAAPVITSPAAATVDENLAGVAYQATATDANANTITYAISGTDAGDFTINPSTGAVTFVSAPNFEAPADANGDNVYAITIAASDGMATTTLAVTITVRDIAEAFAVRRVATGFSQPLFITGAGDGSGRLFVVEKTGLVRIFNPSTGAINATPFLNVSAQISTNSERGLLGLAFPPNYATSGMFYAYLTNLAGDSELRRYTVSSANANVAQAGAGALLLTFAQPASNHNGGWIGFGADGFLYVASGDGGGNASTTNPAQNTSSLLGKILRIDVSGDDFPADANRNYRIPAGNPFAAGGGAPEVFAYGLRNPFRASFDRLTGRLIIGDVGEGAREEIDVIPPGTSGQNFGWVRFEGTDVFNASATAPNALPPVLQYVHGSGPSQGNSVTGGVVNRGPVEALEGEYIFGDFISGRIFTVPAASLVQGTTLLAGQFMDRTAMFAPNAGAIGNIPSFGTDDLGNVYIVDFDGEIFRLERP